MVTCVPYFAQYQTELGRLVESVRNLMTTLPHLKIYPSRDEWLEIEGVLWELDGQLKELRCVYSTSQANGEDYVYVPREAARRAGLI